MILRILLFINCFLVTANCVISQPAQNDAADFSIIVLNEQGYPAEGATVEMIKGKAVLKAMVTNQKGVADFHVENNGVYKFSISYTGYQPQTTDSFLLPSRLDNYTVKLLPAANTLQQVNILSKRAPIQHVQGKTILNVDASVTNTGSTVLEVLEKSPGVMVDKNGGISLQGKAGVLVLIDDKPTYVSGADLNNLLSSMSSSQVDQIELMPNPPAKYDAAGNAGIINIKTKKNKTKGFNGSFTVAAGQGKYPKNNNSLLLNYRTGKFNTFLTYSVNYNKYLSDLYALRKYYGDDGALTAVLDQPTYFSGHFVNNTIKTGVDYFLDQKTTLGISLGGNLIHRKGGNFSSATWLDKDDHVDSTIETASNTNNHFRNGTVNLNAKRTINSSQEISMDLDWLGYGIQSKQVFNNELISSGGYKESTRASIPTDINIFTAKADHTIHFGKDNTVLSGFKLSHINTDNSAAYQVFDGANWQEDYGKSNHFIYKEDIQAVYSSIEVKKATFNFNAGLRYEYTRYNAHQLGNAQQKDSAFSRTYGSLFPSGSITWQADSANAFTFTASRRIDRPAFQVLNPFIFIINKYTYQSGNAYILPQYTGNFEISHQYKEVLTTTVSYSRIKDYFSQLFLTDTIKDILYYSQGNVGTANIWGVSVNVVVSPFSWWSVTAQALYNYKKLSGYNGRQFVSDINQLNLNCNNQFSFGKIYTGELSGFYTTRARNDLQELLYPTGQLSMGVSRPVLKKKGTLKLSFRDIFYTNAMEGFTSFEKATEYFIIKRDSRVVNLAFTYRFGKAYKTTKRSGGSAADEMERVGNGG